MKAAIPPYVRVQRIQRDIPAHQILAGVDSGNLRQRARRALKEMGRHCDCIRCSEAGLAGLSDDGTTSNNIIDEAVRTISTTCSYDASSGKEHFISYRTPDDTLYGYCRLRLEPPLAMVRELKVVGQAVPLEDSGARAGKTPGKILQHRGMGRGLMDEAEKTAIEDGATRMRVTSGVGVRPYYRRLGYRLEAGYMVKGLKACG